MSQTRFRINAESVVHETVDGVVIAIDLANGSYYSLSGSGPVAWELLVTGAGAAEIAAVLEARFDVEPGAAGAAVDDLLARLCEAELVVVADGADRPVAVETPQDGDKEEFVAPVFERYTDMKDYFLLDPIHEVNPAAGWPKPAA